MSGIPLASWRRGAIVQFGRSGAWIPDGERATGARARSVHVGVRRPFGRPLLGGAIAALGDVAAARAGARARTAVVISLALLLWGASGSASAAGGSLAEFEVTPCQNVLGGLSAITAGPDGNLWFTDPTGGIGRLTPSGSSTCFSLANQANPTGIAAGPDGNLWFKQGDDIGRITTAGTVTLFPIPTSSGFISLVVNPSDIAAGPDGNVWFVELGDDQIGRITPAGTITEFGVPTAGAHPSGIAAGSDGNLWFTESGTDRIGRITPTGSITEFPLPTPGSGPAAITSGPDGNVWFTETAANQIGRITPAGAIAEFPVPTPDSGLAAITAGPGRECLVYGEPPGGLDHAHRRDRRVAGALCSGHHPGS